MKTRWSDDATRIFALCNDRPVAYHPALGRLLGIETSLIFVQALWEQSAAEARGAEWWPARQDELAERLGLTVDQLRRHIRPLTDPVTLDRRALLRARITGFGRHKTAEYQLDTALALAYLAARMPASADTPFRSNDRNDGGRLTEMGLPRKREKEEQVCGAAVALPPSEPHPNTHPAVLAFWRASGGRFWPQAGLVPRLIAEVGEDSARVALFQAIQEKRLQRGEMLMDIETALTWLRAGQVPPDRRIATGPGAGARPARAVRLPQVPDPTPEARVASTQTARQQRIERLRRVVASATDETPFVIRARETLAVLDKVEP